ncbi:hypothetical protein D9611_008536 [Ephemerocybe angulata]|uniref:F-box domain-containing protein n=1 Tax=Ephemerocybe angulata TaxID=980116 RepID=A0A8H5AYQ8_9AGAR|nr:hypothetical protein D9611_008536 [Tulosesus angulatus]
MYYSDDWDSPNDCPPGFSYSDVWPSDEEEDDYDLRSFSDERWTSTDESSEEYYEEEEDWSDSDEERSDEDTDAEAQRRTTRTNRPKLPSPSPEVLRRFGKDLSLLPTMPLDVLFEIFSHLEVKDLLKLLWVNRMIRATLLRPNAQSVWAAARVRRKVPKPPTGFTEAGWAIFLFGQKCEICNSMRVRKVDWFLRRRACGKCKREHLKDSRLFSAKFPQYDMAVLDYIPYWERPNRDYSSGERGKDRYFWDDDIHSVAKKWTALSDACLQAQAGATEAFELWKRGQKAKLEAAREDVKEYGSKSWPPADAIRLKRKMDRQVSVPLLPGTLYKPQTYRIRERFIALGYNKVDIDTGVYRQHGRRYIPKIRDEDWDKFRTKSEPSIKAAQAERLAQEARVTTHKRLDLLRLCCERYLSTLSPSERQYVPPVEVFRARPEISRFVDAPLTVAVNEEDFQPFVDQLGRHIVDYQARQKMEALATIPASFGLKEGTDPFELARVIFQCDVGKSTGSACSKFLVTWPMIRSHRCKARVAYSHPDPPTETSPTVVLNQDASVTSSEVITLAGLDPATATIQDMDERGALFVCNKCSDSTSETVIVHTWRTAVYHAEFHHNERFWHSGGWVTNPTTFRVTNAMETKHAKEMSRYTPVWSCNHCTYHLKPVDAVSKSSVGWHLKNVHSIAEPKEGTDYFFNEACRFLLHTPLTYEDVPKIAVENLQCTRCTKKKSLKRRYTEKNMRDHHRGCHSNREPVLNVDYKVDRLVPQPYEVRRWRMKMKATLTGATTNEKGFRL